VGLHNNAAKTLWATSGFHASNLTSTVPGNSVVSGQSLGAATDYPCDTETITLN
jgi:hypothetical protein